MNASFLKKSSVVVLALALGATACFAYPPPPAQVTSVSWLLSTQHDDQVDGKRVALIGRVTRPDNGSDWWFTDGTGSVRLETGDRELPVGPLLKITGHIDQATWGLGVLEVKVGRWAYANAPAGAPIR